MMIVAPCTWHGTMQHYTAWSVLSPAHPTSDIDMDIVREQLAIGSSRVVPSSLQLAAQHPSICARAQRARSYS